MYAERIVSVESSAKQSGDLAIGDVGKGNAFACSKEQILEDYIIYRA